MGKRLVTPVQERQPWAPWLRGCVQTDRTHLHRFGVSGSKRLFSKHGRVTEAIRPELN